MALEADYAALKDGSTKARTGGENIASAAQQMFAGLGEQQNALIGQAGSAFQRVQTVMQEQLVIIDRNLDQVAEGIDQSSLTFDSQDVDGSAEIDKAVDGTVDDLLKGK
ncbi:hypothetical protein [Stackebrandtia nassauensis]|uniref:Uncharacterized protein n=1 Tax=Stackebrandtia nassauensis (strain DSM 44728 / CIP 108903 / NRRL B-16338 / NBRC 102104 / LLR-40K-21) TaxID=446470 RepID=D3Q706_STANL|nr:hypothetical protein [Stackebrandtia nassauensis]ADD40405.1 hypothetical protein Snas_0692 [Stackebrandtia nassauensis DSM 44728]